MDNTNLIEKLNHRIAELEAENKSLIAKVRKYEETIAETTKAKKEYEECLKACRELSATYADAVKEARQAKRDLTEQMEKEIANFKKHSAILLNDAKQYK